MKRRIKAIYVTGQFPAPSETFAASDIRALERVEIDTIVCALRPPAHDHKRLLKERGLETTKVYSGSIKNSMRGLAQGLISPRLLLSLVCWIIKNDYSNPVHCIKMLFLLPAAFFLTSRIREEKPDLVHLFWGHYPSIVAYLVKRVNPDIRLTMFLGAYDLEFKLGVSREISKFVEYIFTHAQCNITALEQLGVDLNKVRVVHRGVDIKNFDRKMYIKQDKKIVSAGRLIEEKRLDASIEVLSMIEGYTLTLCGDGPSRQNLEQLAIKKNVIDNIRFLGFVNQKTLFDEMKTAAFFILLSEKPGERLPNVVKEAMLAGCVCIVTNTPGIDELIEHGKSGFIVPAETSVERAADIIDTISEADIKAIGDHARHTIIEMFDVDILINEYAKTWHQNTYQHEHAE